MYGEYQEIEQQSIVGGLTFGAVLQHKQKEQEKPIKFRKHYCPECGGYLDSTGYCLECQTDQQ